MPEAVALHATASHWGFRLHCYHPVRACSPLVTTRYLADEVWAAIQAETQQRVLRDEQQRRRSWFEADLWTWVSGDGKDRGLTVSGAAQAYGHFCHECSLC